jgi:hypothetical protein
MSYEPAAPKINGKKQSTKFIIQCMKDIWPYMVYGGVNVLFYRGQQSVLSSARALDM